MNTVIAMIDPGAAAGAAMITFCLFIVAPIAAITHLIVRRFFLVCFSITAIVTLLDVALWLYFDAGTSRLWISFRLVWVGALLTFATTIVAGIPVLMLAAARYYGKDAYPPRRK